MSDLVDTGKEREADSSDEVKISSNASSSGTKMTEGRIVRGTRPYSIAVHERKNWLIHLHYIRKDFETCKVLIGEMLQETEGMCEYAIYVLGLIKRQEGEISDSLQLFQRAVSLNPNNSAAVKQEGIGCTWRSVQDQGNPWRRESKLSLTPPHFKNFCNIKQAMPAYQILHWFLLGRHKAALETYGEALSLSPKEWEILHNMGVCCIYLKDYHQAVEKLSEAVDLSPQSQSFVQLGRIHLLRGHLEKAMEVYKTAVQHNPDSPDLLTTLGLLHLELGDTKKAFEALGSALTFDPSNARAILAAGAMIQDHGDYDVALSKYRVAAAASPESPHLWNNIGMCLFGKEKHVAAVSCLKRATYLAPFEWKILHNLGLIHLTLHHYASAYHFLRAAVGLNPKSGQLFMLLAVALTHLDDYENACKSYEQALSLEGNNPLIHLNYATLLFNNGETRTARKQIQLFKTKHQSLTSSSADPEVESLATRLDQAIQVREQSNGAKSGSIGRGGDGDRHRRRRRDVVMEEETDESVEAPLIRTHL